MIPDQGGEAMAEYDPFARGPFPVGVRTYEILDAARGRRLPVECWYPAAEAHRGKDLDRETQDRFILMPAFPKMRQSAVRDAEPAGGKFPLVIFSHGLAGHRRQTTHFCTHLASHGYVVASPDHVGNTMPEIFGLVAKLSKGGTAADVAKALTDSANDRPLDVSFTIDAVLSGELGGRIEPARIGMTGHSFGGWTTLAATGRDRRIRAALPLAPAGGRSSANPQANAFAGLLSLEWGRPAPVLLLAADLDSLLPLDGMKELFERIPAPKEMVILKDADHFHFCDGVEQTHEMFRKMGGLSILDPGGKGGPGSMKNARPASELCPGKMAYAFLRGLGLAHLDAHLKNDPDALELLQGDIVSLLSGQGIKAHALRGR